jgi:serine/threonine protein kinase
VTSPDESQASQPPVSASKYQQPPPKIEAEVLVYLGEEIVEKYSITHGEYLIGRDKGCQISVEIEGISRHHARLTFQGYELVIEDLGSSNGVFIEGIQVQLPTRVRPDQQVEIGNARIFIRLKAEASEMLAAALWDPDLGLAPVRALLNGKKYKMMGSIGRGGMGVVHQARDLRIHRQVAMKVIKTASQFSRENVLRFVDEAQLTGQLQHPNIVPVYELALDEQDEVFYTMKYVKGITLDDVLKGLRKGDEAMIAEYSLTALLDIFQKICDGVAYAHSKGVVHRDLKPDNIMIGEYGEVLVMDWGLAKRMSSGMHDEQLSDAAPRDPDPEPQLEMPSPGLREFQTLNGLIVGTPPYISPEAARGELDQISPGSDIYVLGSILYAILTLRPPYPGKEFGELIEQIVSGRFEHPSSFNQSTKGSVGTPDNIAYVLAHLPGRRIPEGLAAIVLKAMSYQMSDRYAKVEDFQDDITAWQNGFAPKAERAGLRKQIQLWAARHKDKVALITVFAVIFHLAVISLFISLKNQRDLAQRNEKIAKDRKDQLDLALADLQGTGPLFFEEAKDLVQKKDFDKAIDRVEAAIRQLPNNAEYHNFRGNLCQTELRLEDAVESYERVLEINPNFPNAKENLALTQKMLAGEGDDHELAEKALSELGAAMAKQDRGVEAAAIKSKSGLERVRFFREIRDVMERDPALQPLRELLADKKEIRGVFQKREDGTFSANFRGRSPAVFTPLLKAHILPISLLKLDDLSVPDLSILSGMKELRELYLKNCKGVRDLSPLAGLRLQSLTLSQTDVSDLTPLANMPLVELRLDGCKRLTDLRPLATISTLRSLILPMNRPNGGIEFLRTMPSLQSIGFRDPAVPSAQFWKQFDNRPLK